MPIEAVIVPAIPPGIAPIPAKAAPAPPPTAKPAVAALATESEFIIELT